MMMDPHRAFERRATLAVTTHGIARAVRGACGVEFAPAWMNRDESVALVPEYEHEGGTGARAGGVGVVACARGANGEVMMRDVGPVDRSIGLGSGGGAVFEARWSAREGEGDRCAFAGADGFLTVSRAIVERDGCGEGEGAISRVRFEEVDRVRCGGEGLGMATCLDWRADGAAAVSAADGSFRTLREADTGLEVTRVFERAHDLEMWAVAFDRERVDVVYTGADDCAFKVWDTRDATRAQATNRSTHRAGVTCVSPSPRNANIVATGSYDDHVRLWDVRALKNPLSELDVGGGVWRCRWHPARDLLACAAMGAGAVLVDATDHQSLHRTFTYDEHDSIVYGADWARLGDDAPDVLVSCSFYDKSIRCWSVTDVHAHVS